MREIACRFKKTANVRIQLFLAFSRFSGLIRVEDESESVATFDTSGV